MLKVELQDAARLCTPVSGRVDPARLTLFSTMKDEIGFLPAWLDHHRALGFEQFLIWDDASTDGSRAYLAAQPDVVVMGSGIGYGQPVLYRDPDGATTRDRFGIYVKIALPHVFFDGAYVGYLDADEFLILPPGVTSVREVVSRLRAAAAPSAVASVIEFFPAAAADLAGALPQSFEALLAAYPFHEAEPLVTLRPGQQPRIAPLSKTAHLFARYDVRPRVERRGWHRLWMPRKARAAQGFQKSPRHKTPLVLRSAESRLTGSHYGNLPPASDILLTVAHFVFTAQFADKIARAIDWGAHTNGAQKYRYYAELLARMDGVADGFLSPRSVRYAGPEGLVAAGLMAWPET